MLKKNFRIFFMFTLFSVNSYSEARHRLENKDFGPNIVGGRAVSLAKYPHAVQFLNYGAMCGGVIINCWSVLTSAHCLENNRDIDEMIILVGLRHIYDFKAKRHLLQSYVVHDNYDKDIPFSNDIAILFVKQPIKFWKMAKRAILVDNNQWMNANEKEFVVTGRGWTKYNGSLTEKYLMMTVLRYIPATNCSRLHNMELSPDMFCLYGDGKRDSCRGDSGGGVLWRGKLVGLTSHGDGCAKKNKPSVYTNLWYLRGWIEEQLHEFIVRYCQPKSEERNLI
ncbi:trypsin alpha-3-like [Spodoptera litura]|uniref:Trypsin alpha-3-like n=1 Tax=Spodoptera litura TaxID=69820 RepID=A0A9J7E2G4_SPOLT|nr:trypsin alpha-3-like [Spodoptera litura]